MPSSQSPCLETPRLGCRWGICALLFFATAINYLDRQVLSILAPGLQKTLHWSELDYGHIVVAFQLAYALALPAAGRLIDRIGTRAGYAIFVGLWSLASLSHTLARSALGFGFARFALGLTEAGNFPAAIKTVAEWFPRKERALATGIFNAGSMVGAVIAPALVPWIAASFGWRAAFLVLACFDFLWLAVWWLIYRRPEETVRLRPCELAYIKNDQASDAPERPRWSQLLRYRAVWAFALGKFLSDPVWWFFLFWLPKFLGTQYHLQLSAMRLPLVVIYTVSAAGSIGGGWICAKLIARGWSLNAARKGVMLACALAVTPVCVAVKVDSLWLAVAAISLATAAHCGWMANLFSLVSDVFPAQMVASITGIGTTAGAIGGMLLAESAGWLLNRTGSYWPLFVIASGSYLLAWTIVQGLIPRIEPMVFTVDSPEFSACKSK